MPYHNRTGDEFHTIADSGVDFDTQISLEAASKLDRGLYFRHRTFPGLASAVQECHDGKQPFGGLTLDAEQAWNETGWKQPHATLAAATRFCDKALEEQRELDEALEEFWDTGESDHFAEELGDFKWLVTAIASNAGVIASDVTKNRLYDYAMGTRVQTVDGSFGYPEWYGVATALAIKQGPLQLQDLDTVVQAGFVPRFSPAMNLYEPEEVCLTESVFRLQGYAVFLRGMNQTLFEKQVTVHQGQGLYDVTKDIGILTAETYLTAAAMANRVGTTFTAVVSNNIRKITGRIDARLVDKADGERSK